MLLVTPSADFFAEHMSTVLSDIKVFHQAGISWTLSSKASAATWSFHRQLRADAR